MTVRPLVSWLRDRAAVRRASRRRAHGSAAVFVVGFAVVLLGCAGLVIDGGSALNARMKLADDTEQAARAGAQQIDVVYLREHHVVRLNQSMAQQAANQYLTNLGYTTGSVFTNGDSVTVRTSETVPTKLLNILPGLDHFHISASATAQAVTQ